MGAVNNSLLTQLRQETEETGKVHVLKQYLQSHLSDGLVVIIGSGLSCSEGLPGMGALANFLNEKLPPVLLPEDKELWEKIAQLLGSIGLEATLLQHQPSESLEAAIVDLTGEYILPLERQIIANAISGQVQLRFSRLLKHLYRPSGASTGIPVVTTNYDRLIEVGAELAGFGADTLFVGSYAGQMDHQRSHFSFCKGVSTISSKAIRNQLRERVTLCKVHGSFDWYLRPTDNTPIRHIGDLNLPRLIITPGLNKYRNGYNPPFDKHREKANNAISNATKILVIGYGFNDDHLETYLRPKIKQGTPTVLLTYETSDKALELVGEAGSNFIALERSKEQADNNGTTLRTRDGAVEFPDSEIWDVNGFISEVFEQ